MSYDREAFQKTVKAQEVAKLFNAMKYTQPTFFTKMIKIFEGYENIPVNKYKRNGNTYITYVPNALFEDLFGPITLVFKGNLIKSGNIIDISPKEYFYDSFRSGCHEYKGVVIPNVGKYQFRVDLMLAQNKGKYSL